MTTPRCMPYTRKRPRGSAPRHEREVMDMGYTHYWYRPKGHEDREAFRQLGTDALAIMRTASVLGIEVAGWDGTGEPEFTELSFAFNGVGEYSHETFRWDSLPTLNKWDDPDGSVFACTKTAHKPYDAVVTAILVRAKLIYEDAVRISSDGEWNEWIAGRRLYLSTFGEIAPWPFDEYILRVEGVEA